MVDRKLSFLVEKISREFGIFDSTDANVDIVYRNILISNREYQRRSAVDVRSAISSVLKNSFGVQSTVSFTNSVILV